MEKNNPTTANITGRGMVYPPVKVRTSGKDVIASGTANTFSHDNLEIEIAQFKFIFNFMSSGTGPKIEYRNDGNETLILDIYNFNNSLGMGVDAPIRIGTLMDRELFLGFMVYTTAPTAPKLVHYTFTLGERV